jgi:hypothetical protein
MSIGDLGHCSHYTSAFVKTEKYRKQNSRKIYAGILLMIMMINMEGTVKDGSVILRI